jgi:hypothetical protein
MWILGLPDTQSCIPNTTDTIPQSPNQRLQTQLGSAGLTWDPKALFEQSATTYGGNCGGHEIVDCQWHQSAASMAQAKSHV